MLRGCKIHWWNDDKSEILSGTCIHEFEDVDNTLLIFSENEKILMKIENSKRVDFSNVDDLKFLNLQNMHKGMKLGWWKSVDEKGNPVPFPIILHFRDFPEKSFMSHAMVKAGLFESVNDARKNGWNKPLEKGIFKVKRKVVKIV